MQVDQNMAQVNQENQNTLKDKQQQDEARTIYSAAPPTPG